MYIPPLTGGRILQKLQLGTRPICSSLTTHTPQPPTTLLQNSIVNNRRRRRNLNNRRSKQDISIRNSRILALAGDEHICLTLSNSRNDSRDNGAVDGALDGSDAQTRCECDEAAGGDVGGGREGVG